MARLFIGSKEQSFISDVSKEFSKDILGQFIILYPISPLLTDTHPVYNEAIEKIFENPIKLDVLAGQPERENNWNEFGLDQQTTIEIYVQARDLIDKKIVVENGDFFVYGYEVFEIIDSIVEQNIFGQAERDKAVKIIGKLARVEQFDLNTFKYLLEQSKKFQDSNEQKKFVQQRGLAETEEGITNDHRQINDRLGDDLPEIALGEGPRKIDLEEEDENGNPLNPAEERKTSTFYDE